MLAARIEPIGRVPSTASSEPVVGDLRDLQQRRTCSCVGELSSRCQACSSTCSEVSSRAAMISGNPNFSSVGRVTSANASLLVFAEEGQPGGGLVDERDSRGRRWAARPASVG